VAWAAEVLSRRTCGAFRQRYQFGHRREHRAQPSRPLNRSGPYPDLVLVGWCSEPHQHGALGPGNCIGLHQLLGTVFPQDPGPNPLRDGRGGDGGMPHLLGLQTPGLTLGKARTFGHRFSLSDIRSIDCETCWSHFREVHYPGVIRLSFGLRLTRPEGQEGSGPRPRQPARRSGWPAPRS
jgi:hypothetical protein